MSDIDQTMTPEMQDVIGRIQKLLNLAAKAGTEAEAIAAKNKADELLLKYNLEAAVIEKGAGKDGKREELKVEGGFYAFQRELWTAVARLNFCLYWQQQYKSEAVRYVDIYTGATSMQKGEGKERRKVKVFRWRHALVGRIINTRATVNMVQYLEQTIEHLLTERLKDNNEMKQSNWAHSFRKGLAARVIEKIEDRREMQLSDERKKQRAAAAAAGEMSTSTALTLSTYIDEETDANMDFVHGAGWSAEQAKRRAEAARRAKEREEEYTRWAAANPEEARKRQEEAEARWRKQSSRYRGGSTKRDNTDYSAYSAGRRAGDAVSIDPQARDRRAGQGRIAGPKAMHL